MYTTNKEEFIGGGEGGKVVTRLGDQKQRESPQRKNDIYGEGGVGGDCGVVV